MTDKLKNNKFKISDLPKLLLETYKEWNKDDPWRLSAVIAYYALLSLPAFLVIIINIVGAIWGTEIVQGKLTDEISSALGHDAADSIQAIIESTQSDNKNILSTIIGVGTLIFGATGIFYHLQLSLNEIWDIKVDSSAGWKKLFLDRARSFGFVLVIGFLLLISFVLTTLLSVLSEYISSFSGELVVYFTYITDLLLSIGIITLLFALMYKYLPDAQIQWETVWVGALLTSLLFVAGKFLIGFYFGQTNPGSTYGAAGSVVLMLLWVSYSSLILFFGAEFTYVYAKHYGIKIKPDKVAYTYKEKRVVVSKGADVNEENIEKDP
ncbi:YihY/virulence factor BrkB family protein [Membranicola marinus]|uniref:YihY/virulence factor BrkB family protein n=1 Tax=Membranihabitans marinus TaxID=1227546 RepID=A0A953HKC0_9BACT|nr:YihY/virulence factor BrkB family protein [Membranihabitans marinus]MBY5957277.1 YihY/virulence factor BrkB family protein [Membranihabitans marinus]